MLKKPPEILNAIRSSQIDYTKAVEISKLKNLEDREALLEAAINQRLSLSEVKQQVKSSLTSSKESVPTPKPNLKSRFKTVMRQMDKAKVWADD